jgi:hypothetical protein
MSVNARQAGYTRRCEAIGWPDVSTIGVLVGRASETRSGL